MVFLWTHMEINIFLSVLKENKVKYKNTLENFSFPYVLGKTQSEIHVSHKEIHLD
jgi:hypothetical protein